jgi:hypothetical protein
MGGIIGGDYNIENPIATFQIGASTSAIIKIVCHDRDESFCPGMPNQRGCEDGQAGIQKVPAANGATVSIAY